ncbi:hypothetical protein H1R20_g1328, partial [Candolleomyces eurysporus]
MTGERVEKGGETISSRNEEENKIPIIVEKIRAPNGEIIVKKKYNPQYQYDLWAKTGPTLANAIINYRTIGRSSKWADYSSAEEAKRWKAQDNLIEQYFIDEGYPGPDKWKWWYSHFRERLSNNHEFEVVWRDFYMFHFKLKTDPRPKRQQSKAPSATIQLSSPAKKRARSEEKKSPIANHGDDDFSAPDLGSELTDLELSPRPSPKKAKKATKKARSSFEPHDPTSC